MFPHFLHVPPNRKTTPYVASNRPLTIYFCTDTREQEVGVVYLEEGSLRSFSWTSDYRTLQMDSAAERVFHEFPSDLYQFCADHSGPNLAVQLCEAWENTQLRIRPREGPVFS